MPRIDGPQRRQAQLAAGGFGILQKLHLPLDGEVGHAARGVAQVGRAQRRKNQVRPLGNAPITEGLAEIFALTRQPHARCRVPEAAHTQDAVEQETCSGVRRALALELSQAVEQRRHFAEVAEEIAHAGAHRPRRDVAIAAHHRQHHPLIEPIVEVVDAPVDRLERIVDVQCLEGGALELALIQAGIELQIAQRMGETILIHLRRVGEGQTTGQKQRQQHSFSHGRTPACVECLRGS